MALRRVPLEGAFNFRDLGGYAALGGASTQWGRLYRSDCLSRITARDWEELARREVRTIVDLRSAPEVAQEPVSAPEGVTLLNYSLMRELDELAPAGTREGRDIAASSVVGSMRLDYAQTLLGNLACAVRILEAILEHLEAGSVVFLCSAGKDRTGITAALLLYLCGVQREDIVADYMVSGVYNQNGINRKLEQVMRSDAGKGVDIEALRRLLESDPKTVEALLDALEEKDICARLDESGFSFERQEALVGKICG